jgi:two-component system chemotaxis response regulator CheB
MIRVVVAEDSPTARELILSILEADPEIQVVGSARDGVEALELTLQLRPHLVTMDVHMPRLDGLAATRAIMRQVPTPILIVSASARDDDLAMSFGALEAGALAVVEKPGNPGHPTFDRQAERLREKVHLMAGVKLVRDRRPEPRADVPSTPRRPAGSSRLIAIAASTGGPPAILQILRTLRPDFPAPILIVQHIATGFVAGFVSWLAQASNRPVELAVDGRKAEAGKVYIAPDGVHLEISRDGKLRLSDADPVGGHRPSADRLFHSVAESGIPAAAVILTGMGRDGAGAMTAMHNAGVQVIAQNEATSVVFGMPRAAIETGLINEVLPVNQIGSRLNALAFGAR